MDPTTSYASPAGLAAILAVVSAHGQEIPHAIHLLHHLWGPVGGLVVGVVVGSSLNFGSFWGSVVRGIGAGLGYVQEHVKGA